MAENCKNDPKRFFSFYKMKDIGNKGVGPFIRDGEVIADSMVIVDVLNDYFSSVFMDEGEGGPSYPNMDDVGDLLMEDSLDISSGLISKFIRNIKPNKAPGPDGIYARALREGADSILKALELIFKKSFSCSEVPFDWKQANITPIFKKGNRAEVSNYRPISLCSIVGKLFERVVRGKVQSHLDTYNLLKDSQHGFRSGRSCCTNLLSCFDYVTGKIDEGDSIDIVYLDFSKAFDKVPHAELLYKLRSHGIRGRVYSWIAGRLMGRVQRVVLNGYKSSWKPVCSGVPTRVCVGAIVIYAICK